MKAHNIKRLSKSGLLTLSILLLASQVNAAKGKYFKQEMTIGGVKREYYIYQPASLKKGKKAPAVIAFHGYHSDANGIRWLIKADKWAEKFGYIMIYPNAIKKSWNVGKGFGSANKKTDDLSFAAALPDVIAARHPIDKNRIYAMGFSNGAQMANLMLCKLPHKIAAIGMVSHTMNINNCNPKLKVPVAIIHGLKDKMVPYSGGGKFNINSHKNSVAFFKQVNEIKSNAKETISKKTVKCTSYKDKKARVEVISCSCFDAGHSWPGGVEFMVDKLGKVNKELNANEFLFSFFKKYTGKATPRKSKQLVNIEKLKTTQNNLVTNNRKQAGHTGMKLKKYDITVNGKKRNYEIIVPDIYPSNHSNSIHLVFGPNNINSQTLAKIIDAEILSRRYLTTLVFPKGDWQKNDKKDSIYLSRVLEDVKNRYVYSTENVYAIGYSSGGNIVQRLYCEDPQMVTAIGFVGYGWRETNCNPVIALPVYLLHSKQDKKYPFKGNKEKNIMSFAQTVKLIQSHQNDILTKTIENKKNDHRCAVYKDREQQTAIYSCSVDWGGNTIPGTSKLYPKSMGEVMTSFNAVASIMNYFTLYSHHHFTPTYGRSGEYLRSVHY